MFAPPPKVDDSLGLRAEDFPPEVVDVWPDNWRAAEFFSAVGAGAWSIGGGGPVGIRPEAFREIRLAVGVSAAEWRAMYPDVMVMEDEALRTMREAHDR